MGLSKKTRLLLEDLPQRNGTPELINLAEVASKFNKQKDIFDLLAQGELELNANIASVEKKVNAFESLTKSVGDVAGGSPVIAEFITMEAEKNAIANAYAQAAAIAVVNTNGVGADVNAVSLGINSSVSGFMAVVTVPTFTLAAGSTAVIRIQGESKKTAATGLSVIQATAQLDGTPTSVTAPIPTSMLTAPADQLPIDWTLLYDADAGVNITGGWLQIASMLGSLAA